MTVKEGESNDDLQQAYTNSNVNVFNIEKDGHSNGQRKRKEQHCFLYIAIQTPMLMYSTLLAPMLMYSTFINPCNTNSNVNAI
jgi:hypothetical protein